MDFKKMDNEALGQTMLQKILELQIDGLVNDYFRECYALKDLSGPSFFLDLITVFLLDARNAVKAMHYILRQPIVDSRALHGQCMKLKGSSLCIGACTLRDGCDMLFGEIEKESIPGCKQAAQIIDTEHTKLYTRMTIIMKLEQEIMSRK